MDLNNITVAMFKAHFRRDFPYLNVWDSQSLYNEGTRVYYESTDLFYDCLVNGTIGTVPTDVNSWRLASDDTDNYIQDDDITKAFSEAQVMFNQELFGSDAQITLAYMYVVAHYLAIDIRNSKSGIMATGGFPMLSRSAGNVSESYAIPNEYLSSPLFSMFAQTGYGMKYLSLVLPRIIGNVGVVCGGTLP